MVIKGLTDSSLQRFSNYSAIVHKGGRKPSQGYGFGKDLNNFFRIELKDPSLKYRLLDFGFKKLPSKINTLEGEVLTNSSDNDYCRESINIFLTSEEIDKAFPTAMQLWDKTGLVHECDRSLIYRKRTEGEDLYGHKRSIISECREDCFIANESPQIPCPKGCKSSGTLSFYIASFVDYGCWRESKLTVTSVYDIQSIYDCLNRIKREFGSFCDAPPNFPGYRGMIPLILKRAKFDIKKPILDKTKKVRQGDKDVFQRTGKKADSFMWITVIEVNPDWVQSYYAWQQCQNIMKLGYTPDSVLLQRLPGVETAESTLIDPSPVVPDLPPDYDKVEVVLGDEQFNAIAEIFEQNKQHPEWKNKEDFAASLKKIYGFSIKKIPLSDFDKVKNYLLLKEWDSES